MADARQNKLNTGSLKSHNTEVSQDGEKKKQLKMLFVSSWLSSQKEETDHKVVNQDNDTSTDLTRDNLLPPLNTGKKTGTEIDRVVSTKLMHLSPPTISKHQLGKTRRRKSSQTTSRRAMSLPVHKTLPGNWPIIATTTQHGKMEKLEETEEEEEEESPQQEEEESPQEEEEVSPQEEEEESPQQEEEEGEEEREERIAEHDIQESKMSKIVNITNMAKQWKTKTEEMTKTEKMTPLSMKKPRDETEIQRILSEAVSKDLLGEALQEAQMLVAKTEILYKSYLGSQHVLTITSGQHAKYLQEEVINHYNISQPECSEQEQGDNN